MDYEKLLDRAKKYIDEEVKVETIFEAKSLFEGVEWETLTRGEKINFGRYFANAVSDARVENVIRIERAKNNHARYKKVEGNKK